MGRFYYAFAFLCLCVISDAQAQKQAICGFDDFHEARLKDDAGYRLKVESMDQEWSEFVKNTAAAQQRIVVEGADTIIEIPVVIHVVHTGGAVGTNYNRPDAELVDWVAYLNQVFAGTYPAYAGSGSAPLPIRFVLAKRDPNCDPTNGIVRVNGNTLSGYNLNGLASSGGSGVAIADLKTLSQWPPNDYYNIYVVNRINGEDGFTTTGQYVAGFAVLGNGFASPDADGAYMLSYTAVPGNITLPHELGHAFGLYHTFQSTGPGCPPNADCTQDGDMVCDTDPTESLLGVPCPGAGATNPCTGQPYGVNGVQYNLMNYTSCTANHFTPGQADRMRFMVNTYRPELMHSRGAVPPPATASTGPIPTTCVPAGINNNVSTNIGPTLVHLDSIHSVTHGFFPQVGSTEFYTDFNGRCDGDYHTTLTVGQTHQLTVAVRGNQQFIKAYIDYNNDGDFNDPGEQIMDLPQGLPDTFTITFTPPATAVQNTPLRMRVIADLGSTASTPCGNLNYGQVEDYAVTIVPDNPLPLGLLAFKGRTTGDAAVLEWAVNPEAPISGFELERSRDGRNFKGLAKIAYSGKQTYAYTDPMEAPGAYYYRLKIHEGDQTDFSRVVALVASSAQAPLYCYPNPTTDVLHIQSGSSIKTIRLMSSTGQLLKSLHPDTPQYTLSLEGLAVGVYLVRIIESDGSVTQKKVTKQ